MFSALPRTFSILPSNPVEIFFGRLTNSGNSYFSFVCIFFKEYLDHFNIIMNHNNKCCNEKLFQEERTTYLMKYIHINVKNLLFLQPEQIHCMKAELCIYSLCQSFFVLQLKNIYFSAVAKNKK